MTDLYEHAPPKIYLQHDVEDEGHPFPKDWDGDEVTWCRDRQAESDVEYVRADIATQARGPAIEAADVAVLDKAWRLLQTARFAAGKLHACRRDGESAYKSEVDELLRAQDEFFPVMKAIRALATKGRGAAAATTQHGREERWACAPCNQTGRVRLLDRLAGDKECEWCHGKGWQTRAEYLVREQARERLGIPMSADCHCEACDPIRMDPVTFESPNMRMIVCAICGNKRCPHATDHRNACTNSNAPGQKGSSWENYPPGR